MYKFMPQNVRRNARKAYSTLALIGSTLRNSTASANAGHAMRENQANMAKVAALDLPIFSSIMFWRRLLSKAIVLQDPGVGH